MMCGRNAKGRVNRSRLAVLIGTLTLVAVGGIYAARIVPGLGGVLPFLLFAALCPLSCAIGKVVSWVRGGKEVAELQSTK